MPSPSLARSNNSVADRSSLVPFIRLTILLVAARGITTADVSGGRIVSSNSYSLAAQCREAGAEPLYLGIARGFEPLLLVPIESGPGPFAAPDILFYICGATIGAAGGALQAASRTLMVDQADSGDMTKAFGLYALSGKATAFLAPALIAFFTGTIGQQALGLSDTAAQRFGISPIVLLFLIGLALLTFVRSRHGAETSPA